MSRVANWSKWMPLNGAGRNQEIPGSNGLYRVRVKGTEKVIYIGETGGRGGLRERLGSLSRGIYQPNEMPYRDPHTAAPALWAFRHRDKVDYEVSVSVFSGSKEDRNMLEAVELALHRSLYGSSPSCNFGRMPRGYKMSSKSDADLRGGPTEQEQSSWTQGCSPVGRLDQEVTSKTWCGHSWTNWESLERISKLRKSKDEGLYRIRSEGASKLIYIGRGNIIDRLKAHFSSIKNKELVKGQIFAKFSPLEASFTVLNPNSRALYLRHQMEELETDLIGAHGLGVDLLPEAQFKSGKIPAAKKQ